MVRIRWASTHQGHIVDLAVAPVLNATTLEALFDQWQAAPDQLGFMAHLPLDQADALCGFILARVPPGTPTKHALLLAQRKEAKQRAKKKRATKKRS